MAPTTSSIRRLAISSALLMLLGLWLIASPYILDFAWHPEAWWNAVIIGLSLFILALLRFSAPRRFKGLHWTAVVVGGWIFISPFVADYIALSAAFYNAMICGALILLIALFPTQRQRYTFR